MSLKADSRIFLSKRGNASADAMKCCKHESAMYKGVRLFILN